jgi:hypothetical protein
MPIHGYPGGVITANPVAPTASVATGVWTTEQQLQAVSQGNWPGYEYPVNNSLRFNSADSAYLNRTPASAGNRMTFTFNAWVKRSTLGTVQQIIGQGAGVAGGGFCIYFNSNDTIRVYSGSNDYLITNAVFRDPSAWYMITLLVDTTQATAANRVRLFVNGVEQTYSSTNYPAQNTDTTFNQALEHRISGNTSATYILNSYLTEVNFVDGQALTPSSFGLNDPETGVWSPKRYTGTYGTNGFYLPMNAGSTWSGFFDGSNDYLSVASNAAWQYGTGDFTVECWLLGTSSGALSNQYPLGRYNTSASAYGALQIGNSTTIYWYYANGGAYSFTLGTALTTNRWYHFAVSRSGTSLRFFLDGTQIGSTQTDSTNYSGTAEFRIVNAHQTSATYFPGYISNVRVVKGSAVYTANFTPSTTPLTAITNTVLLTCQSSTFIDNSTNNFTITNNGGALNQLISPFAPDVVDDASGNGNNWQPNNLDLRTTGVGADILVDSPTSYGTDTGVGGEVRGNYCTMNPLTVPTLPTLANGNLDVSVSATGVKIAQGTFQFPSSGKWYFECTFNNASSAVNGMFIGITSPTRGPNVTRSTAGAYFFYAASSGLLNSNGTDIVTGLSTISANEVFKLAVDIDNSKVWIGRGSTWYNSSGGTTGDPAAGTNPTFSISAIGLTPMSGFDASSVSLSMNFGQRSFNTTAPSGFKALCTQNLPPVTIGATSTTQANDYFNPVLYTGTGSSLGVTGVGFQPDLVWIKGRSGATDHGWYDAVRGVQKQLESNTTTAETTETTGLTAFGSDGFTVGALAQLNTNTATYVAWNWKANGAGSSNTAGTITSTVSANTTSGFSIVKYTGNATTSQTVGHGLGVAPAMVIIKSLGIQVWNVSFLSIADGNNILQLQSTAAVGTGSGLNITKNATTFGIGSDAQVNGSGTNYVAYCFAPVAGYSAFGSYTGNASADGPFIYTGFRPEFVMIKCSSTTGDWVMQDVARSPYNVSTNYLVANASTAEQTGQLLDFVSNGFKIRVAVSGAMNSSGVTYIYAAFAENPFKYSLAR